MAGLFTKIIAGEIPCYKIYENEHVFSFLARDQIKPGHTLIVPKTEIDYFLDVPEPFYSAVFQAAKPIGRALQKATGCTRVAASVLGMEVPHFHLHLVPIQSEGDMSFRHAQVFDDSKMKEIQAKLLASFDN